MCTKPLFSQRHSCYHCKFDYSILTDNVPAILQPRSDTHSNQADINDLRQLIRYHQDRESRRLYQKVAARKQDESDKSSDTAGREEPGVVLLPQSPSANTWHIDGNIPASGDIEGKERWRGRKKPGASKQAADSAQKASTLVPTRMLSLRRNFSVPRVVEALHGGLGSPMLEGA